MSCDDTCVNTGIKTLEQIVQSIIQGSQPAAAPVIIQLLTNALLTFRCKLPPQVLEQLKEQLSVLSDISIATLSQVNTAYIVVIFLTLFLLTLFNYISILSQSTNITVIMMILSVFIIIAATIGLYIWISSIYRNVSTDALTNIRTLLNDVIRAGQEGFCCLGSCSSCSTCPIT